MYDRQSCCSNAMLCSEWLYKTLTTGATTMTCVSLLGPSATTSVSRNEYTITTTISIPCSTQLASSSIPSGRDICPTVTRTIMVPTSVAGWRETCPTLTISNHLVPTSVTGWRETCPTVTTTISNHLVPQSVTGWRETCPTVTTTITNDLITTSVSGYLMPTSVPGWRETCEGISGSVVIAVSAVSLLLIVTLTTVILTQCLLMIRMRRPRNRNVTYTGVMTPTTMHKGVPVSPNEAYAVTKMTTTGEEVIYELVK